ncbi:MAG: hypothetical protein C0396_01625 [Anaerolinea sp.]|nr:hypothetical protein [Anaerolinea sp.]
MQRRSSDRLPIIKAGKQNQRALVFHGTFTLRGKENRLLEPVGRRPISAFFCFEHPFDRALIGDVEGKFILYIIRTGRGCSQTSPGIDAHLFPQVLFFWPRHLVVGKNLGFL